jgi:hypothetical protein
MFLKSIIEKISNILGMTTPKKKPTACWVFYAKEECIGGSPYPLEDFQKIMNNYTQLNDHNTELLLGTIHEKDTSGMISICLKENNSLSEDYSYFIPQSIIFEDINENVRYAICRIKDKCEWVRYAYFISDKKGHRSYDYIGKNDPVTDSSTIERLKKRLAVYVDLQIALLKKQEGKGEIAPQNIQISKQFQKEWLSLADLLSIPSSAANRICMSVLGEEDLSDAFLSEMIAADYLQVIDWKTAAEDVIYNYNLLSKQLKGKEIDLEIDNNTPPDEVFQLLAAKSEFALYYIDIGGDSYIIGLCPKENAEAAQRQYGVLFSMLEDEASVLLIS